MDIMIKYTLLSTYNWDMIIFGLIILVYKEQDLNYRGKDLFNFLIEKRLR